MKRINMILVLVVVWHCLCGDPAAAKKYVDLSDATGIQQKSRSYDGSTPTSWNKQYHVGEILDRPTFDNNFIVEPENIKGIVGIQIGDKIVRVVRSTRQIVEIVDRK